MSWLSNVFGMNVNAPNVQNSALGVATGSGYMNNMANISHSMNSLGNQYLNPNSSINKTYWDKYKHDLYNQYDSSLSQINSLANRGGVGNAVLAARSNSAMMNDALMQGRRNQILDSYNMGSQLQSSALSGYSGLAGMQNQINMFNTGQQNQNAWNNAQMQMQANMANAQANSSGFGLFSDILGMGSAFGMGALGWLPGFGRR